MGLGCRAVATCDHPLSHYEDGPSLTSSRTQGTTLTFLCVISPVCLLVWLPEAGLPAAAETILTGKCQGNRHAYEHTRRAHRHEDTLRQVLTHTLGYLHGQGGGLTFRASGSAKQTWAPHWMPVHKS